MTLFPGIHWPSITLHPSNWEVKCVFMQGDSSGFSKVSQKGSKTLRTTKEMITNVQLWNPSFIITQIQCCFRTAEWTAYSHCPVLWVSIKRRLSNTWYRNNVAISNIPKFILSLWSSKYQRLAPLNNSQINKNNKRYIISIFYFKKYIQSLYNMSDFCQEQLETQTQKFQGKLNPTRLTTLFLKHLLS